MSVPELGEVWQKRFYSFIRDSLGLNEKADIRSRDLLYSLLLGSDYKRCLSEISKETQGRESIVFGAGPSLQSDIDGLREHIRKKSPLLVAADGAAEALREFGLVSDLIISDLDSCSLDTLRICALNGYVFAHAHGDNVELIRTIVPKLPKNSLGTTQVHTKIPVYNFGGFTDGDRACYVTSFFRPTSIVIAGMDFGDVEGEYSVNKYDLISNPKRPLKLEWGKKSLEFLITIRPEIQFRNVTKYGLEIRGAKKTLYEELT